MLASLMGVFLLFFGIGQITDHGDFEQGRIHYWHPVPGAPVYESEVVVKPFSDFQYRNVVRQAFDYSCGSAALTTVLNYYLGRKFAERQVMEGLLQYGETDKIVERRGFSLLDMKRLVTALGHPSGGFRATFEDVKTLDHPAIVPIAYAGFKHFVVVKGYVDGHVYVADPALGNISFTEERFKDVWEGYRERESTEGEGKGVLFIVFPNGFEPQKMLAVTESDMRVVNEAMLPFHLQPYNPSHVFFNKPMENLADEAASLAKLLISKNDFETEQDYINYISEFGHFEPVRVNNASLKPYTVELNGQLYQGVINIPTRTYLKN